jgi:pilus assembly protein FimV
MIRTKAALAVVACMAGVVSGSIAAAQADNSGTGATGTTGAAGASGTPATITVNGSGAVTADPSVTGSAAQTDYLTALGDALTDAHTHAATLAGAVGDTLGAVQNITEESNDTYLCSGPVFAAGTAKGGAPVPAVSPGTSKKKHHSKPKPKATAMIAMPMSASGTGAAAGAISTPAGVGATVTTGAIARIADVVSTSCTIEASVTVTYAMSAS